MAPPTWPPPRVTAQCWTSGLPSPRWAPSAAVWAPVASTGCCTHVAAMTGPHASAAWSATTRWRGSGPRAPPWPHADVTVASLSLVSNCFLEGLRKTMRTVRMAGPLTATSRFTEHVAWIWTKALNGKWEGGGNKRKYCIYIDTLSGLAVVFNELTVA